MNYVYFNFLPFPFRFHSCSMIYFIVSQGIGDLRKLLVEKALNTDFFPAYNLNKGSEQLCVEVLRLRQQSLIVQTLTDFKKRAKCIGIEDDAVLAKIMEDLNMVVS